MEAGVLWALNHAELLREGYAYVGVSAQQAGVSSSPVALKFWDPVRYQPLNHPGDDYASDIMAQAARALFARSGPAPLGPLNPQRVIAAGLSQSSGKLIAYANHVDHEHRVFDGFFLHAFPAPIREDIDVPVMMVLTETEKEGITSGSDPGASKLEFSRGLPPAGPPSEDGANFRLWEIAGGSHYDQQGLYYSVAVATRDLTAPLSLPVFFSLPALCVLPPNQLATERPTMAALHALNQWMISGRAPPSMPRLEQGGDGSLVRDADGLAQGGIRVPRVTVPIGVNNGADCTFFGSYRAFTDAELRSRYPSPADYRGKVMQAAEDSVARGWLLQPEAAAYVGEANSVNVWSP
jgi:hypothetical protein